MELSEAIELIQNEHLTQPAPAQWADLGCGNGLFTYALANLLAAGSQVHAVDKEPVSLRSLSNPKAIAIHSLQLDFVSRPLPLRELDGILMANSLHYVRDKKALLTQLSQCLKPEGRFLIVEYDTDKGVQPWVPFPLSYRSLPALFASVGYAVVERLGERPSLYGRANLYAAVVGPKVTKPLHA